MVVAAPLRSVRCWAVVPAAGRGQRLGGDLPKQYLLLGERTVAERTLECILGLPDIASVTVAVAAEDSCWRSLPPASDPRVQTVIGGATRAASVLNALAFLAEQAALEDWVLVHDVVRPCVSPERIQLLREELAGHPVGGLLAIPVTDTLHRADDTGDLLPSEAHRENLWRAQTPQMFRYGLLREALQAAQDAGETMGDEAAAMLRAGHRPRAVQGSADNIKITMAEDLHLARSLLSEKEGAGP